MELIEPLMEEGQKVLVFSQFFEMLAIIEAEIQEHGGQFFNLTAASYVVLFDPCWNPAVEAQAIDRTHRIG